MRIGVRLGPVWVSTSTHSRRRRRRSSASRPRQPSWHAKGKATTPDGREVDFRCQHSHRSQDAALKCSATVRKQIENGQSLHLITRVRSTPASREAARQRAAQKEARIQAKAAQRAQAAQQRAQQQERRRQAKAAGRAQPAQQNLPPVVPWQPPAATPPQFAQRTQQPLQQHEEGPSYHPTGQRQPFQQSSDHVNRRYAAPSQPRSLSWPVTGLITAGTATVLGMVLAGVAGNNPRSALATTAGGIVTLGIIGVVVFAIVALVQRRSRRKNQGLAPTPATPEPRNAYPAPAFTGQAFQAPSSYLGLAAADQQPKDAHQRPYGHGAPWPPHEGSTQWNS
jgi:hypothetical protein